VRRSHAALLFGLLVAAFFAVSIPLFDRCLDDDAFISFRYARNLIRGEGLVYNPGEPVEGYTNFLWVILNGVAMAAGAAPEASSQVLGLLFGAAAVALLFLLGWRAGMGGWSALAPAALVALLPFSVECLLGLEMPLFVFLLVAAVGLHAAEERPRSAAATGLVFALAAMTRPEGLLVLGLSALADVLAPGQGGRFPWRRWAGRAVGFLAVYGPYYAWRFSYYGLPLPNTFYAKTGGELAGLGAEYVGGALLRVGPLALLGLALLWRRRENPRFVPLAALTVIAYLGYLVTIGGDFRHHYRFFIPVLPFLLLLAAEGARRLFAAFSARPWRAVALLILGGMVVFAAARMAGPALTWVRYREVRNPQLYAVGEHLRRIGPAGALIAISGGGIVPYVSDLPAIEMWGLTDLHIARSPTRRLGRGVPGHMKGDGAYILSRRPRYILFIATMWTWRPVTPRDVGENVAAPSELDLWQNPRFWREYRLRSVPLPQGGFVNYFERATSPSPAPRG
jgi:hypothetical protein